MSAAPASPNPTNLLMLLVLGAGVYYVMTHQARAGTNTGWLAGRNFMGSPSQASQVGQGAAGLGGLLGGLKGLFSGNSSPSPLPTPAEQAAGVATWANIEKTNLADPLYKAGMAEYNHSSTGDPYASYGDSVAANPSPLVGWDAWYGGAGGMGD